MDLYVLKDYIDKRLNLVDKYPEYKNLHIDFNNNLRFIRIGMSIIRNDGIINNFEIENLKLIRNHLEEIIRKSIKSNNIVYMNDKLKDINNIETDLYKLAINIFTIEF